MIAVTISGWAGVGGLILVELSAHLVLVLSLIAVSISCPHRRGAATAYHKNLLGLNVSPHYIAPPPVAQARDCNLTTKSLTKVTVKIGLLTMFKPWLMVRKMHS